MTISILNALGADDESGALRLIAETNEFLEEARKATGKDSFAAMLGRIRETGALCRDVENATEKPASEAIGAVLAWKQSHEQRPDLEARMAALEENNRAQEVAALIKQGKEDGKLTPAMADFWKTRPAAEVRAFLAVAARVIPAEVKQPAPNGGDITAAADADGRKYEDIKPAERASLKRGNKDLYEALRADWVKRGQPSARSAA